MRGWIKKTTAVMLSAAFLLSAIPAEAATHVTAGQNSVEQGTIVWFDSSDRKADSSTTASELEKKLAEVQEQVDNANSSISSSMGEQYEIMEDFGGIKNPQDVLENQGAASSSNTLSDEEFTELANRLGLESNPFGDAVQGSKPNIEIITIVKEILQNHDRPSDILGGDDSDGGKTANDFFEDDFTEESFKELCDRLGIDPETFLKENSDKMWDTVTSELNKEFNKFLSDFRRYKAKQYLEYLKNKDLVDAEQKEAMEAAMKRYTAATSSNGDLLEVSSGYEDFWDSAFYRQADIVYTCSVCGWQYGWKDGQSLTCACGKHLDNTPRQHDFESPGLDESQANDHYGKCQYCKKEITASNAESFYYQKKESAAGNGTGTFALICSDCANYDGYFYYIPYETADPEGYASGHGDAFLSIGQMGAEDFEENQKLLETDTWYVKKEKDGSYSLPGIDPRYKIAKPEDILGELTPYVQVVNDTYPKPDFPDSPGSDDIYSDDNEDILQDFIDGAMDEDNRNDTEDSLSDIFKLLEEYDDTGYLKDISISPSVWDEEKVQEAFEDAVGNMADTIVEYQEVVINQDKENNAYDLIKDTRHVEGIMDWDDRLTAIFGEWPANENLWSDAQKELYEQFINQYKNSQDGKDTIDDIFQDGILDSDNIEDILESLDLFLDGYTDINDTVKVDVVIDSSNVENENKVYETETMIASSYQIVVNGVEKAEMPWAGGYAQLRCSNIGTYVIRRTCELVRSTIYTGTMNRTIRWTATKGDQTVTLYEKTVQFSYCDTYSKNISGGKERMPDIRIHVKAGDQTDLSVTNGFTSERVY